MRVDVLNNHTNEELKNFYEHILNSDLLCTDENGNRISLYTFFSDYGFTFEKLGNGQNPVFVYIAESSYENFAGLDMSRRYVKESYTGYFGNSTSTESDTVQYFHLHHDGKKKIEA